MQKAGKGVGVWNPCAAEDALVKAEALFRFILWHIISSLLALMMRRHFSIKWFLTVQLPKILKWQNATAITNSVLALESVNSLMKASKAHSHCLEIAAITMVISSSLCCCGSILCLGRLRKTTIWFFRSCPCCKEMFLFSRTHSTPESPAAA